MEAVVDYKLEGDDFVTREMQGKYNNEEKFLAEDITGIETETMNKTSMRFSVGMIESSESTQKQNKILKKQEFKTPKVKLNDRLMEGEINVLGRNFDEEITAVKHEAFESEEKSDNIFNKIGANYSGKRKSSSVTSTKNSTNTSIKTTSARTKQIHLRDSICTSYNIDANKGKFFYDTVQERKNYEDKILSINNRIKKLKEQEDEINRKVKVMKQVAVKEEKIKQDKNETKNILGSKKNEINENLQKKKEIITSEKNKRNFLVEKVKEDVLKKNKNYYDMARTDKMLVESMKTQYYSHIANVNNYKYIKAKQEAIQVKTQRFKKQAEKEEKVKNEFEAKLDEENSKKEQLRKQLKQLEEVEESCLVKLRQTMENKSKEISQLNNSQVKRMVGLNCSMDEEISSPFKTNLLLKNTSSDKKNVRKIIRPKSAMDVKESFYKEKNIFR
jgi:hypothetical protein